MEGPFKEKTKAKVEMAIESIEKLADLFHADGFDSEIMNLLLKELQNELEDNKQKLLRREETYDKKDENDVIAFEDEEGEEHLAGIPLDRRRVYADSSDRSITELYNRFLEGDLVLQPGFQRYYVWDDKKASLLIESILLEVPLPIFYLAEEGKGKYTVVDGQQRLVSLFRFLNPLKIGDQSVDELRLKKLEVLSEYNNFSFKNLPKEIQKKYKSATLRVIEIRGESHPDVKFEIFERLNTGAVKLNDQELRNCVYRGRYNIFIKELAEDKDFLFLLGLKEPHPRMVDRELVLRFLTFLHNTHLNYRAPMKQFLNKEIQKFRDLSPEEEKMLRKEFKKSIELSKTVFGEFAFKRFICGSSARKPQGQWEKRKVNRALFDLILYGFSRYEKHQIIPKADIIREELLWLMTKKEEFVNSILFTTDKKDKVNLRFSLWLQSLEEIVGLPKTEKRNFDLQFKEELWKNNPTCSICGQRIHVLDDAEIDHIEHYWRGGETIPSNARLTHRYCNRARGGRDYSSIAKAESLSLTGAAAGEEKNEARQEMVIRIKDGKLFKQSRFIIDLLESSQKPLSMKEITDYMKSKGYSSKSYYDLMNALIDCGNVEKVKKDGNNAYQAKTKKM